MSMKHVSTIPAPRFKHVWATVDFDPKAIPRRQARPLARYKVKLVRGASTGPYKHIVIFDDIMAEGHNDAAHKARQRAAETIGSELAFSPLTRTLTTKLDP